ncbi:hypothetical protein Taro_019234, partial [Colocasia esculenta]|nr:hypothetical protein [Colocasia esculenta]
MELDDWEISAEELEFLERDAIRKVNERKASSAAASSSSVSCSSPLRPSAAAAPSPFPSPLSPADASRRDATPTLGRPVQSPPARANLERRYEQQASPSKNLGRSPTKADWVNPRNKLWHREKLFLLQPHVHWIDREKQLLVEAFHKIPRASWHAKERLWMFPVTSLSAAEEVLNGIVRVIVEAPVLEGDVGPEEEATVALSLPAPPSVSEDLHAVMEQVEEAFQGRKLFQCT